MKKTIEKSLMCSFMSSVLKIITKLDLFTNISTNEVIIICFKIQIIVILIHHINFQFEIEYIARKPSDFTALVNLVHIFNEILKNLEIDVETSSLWLPYTLKVIINQSIEHPTVSSMYKILKTIFQELDWCILIGNVKNSCSKEIIIEYVACVMEYVQTFKEDLQLCCLEMLLSLPSIIVKEIFNIKILDVVKVIIQLIKL